MRMKSKARSKKKIKKSVVVKRSGSKQTVKTTKRSAVKNKQAQRPSKNKKAVAKNTTEKKSLIQRLIAVLKQRIAQKKAEKKQFPKKFPFWARLKIGKNRTTLVIDEEIVRNKKNNEMVPGFVHREAIHPHGDGSNVKGYEEIKPNPDKTDKKPMYLKSPAKLPKTLFKPHNKDLAMPEHLKEKYEKNNQKKDK